MNRPIKTLMIANRGEIASRIIRTAHRMGIRTLAVFAEGDQHHPFVTQADDAIPLQGETATQTYLDQTTLLRIAQENGVDAIHPGYGFLSENAGFARRCEQAGLIFVGPPASAIDAMGSKAEAKHRMEQAGVPLIPGYHGTDQNPDTLLTEAQKIGFPVLLKASAGGGGKGMRVVHSAVEFMDALETAQRECQKAFGDARMIIEKYLVEPRHIEVQIFFDQQGHGVALFDRDCSVQRRHQKVLEEAPAPGLSDATRKAMADAALACGRAIGYVGAGTIEFLVDRQQQFYFMEMNTRLQVEHPVTEMITGTDLVEWQLRVAAGEALPLTQDQIQIQGHAIEARLYAENPEVNFLPSTGRLNHLRFPDWRTHAGLRIDSGVEEGNLISTHFDPMIAKVICHGDTRDAALQGLAQALQQTRIAGVHTNRDYLIRICHHPRFQAGGVSTHFIEAHAADLKTDPKLPTVYPLAAALLINANERPSPIAPLVPTVPPDSPWTTLTQWRNCLPEPMTCTFWRDETEFTIELNLHGETATVTLDGQSWPVSFSQEPAHLTLWFEGRRYRMDYVFDADHLVLWHDAQHLRFELPSENATVSHHSAEAGSLQAPMGGTIVKVLVGENQVVGKGETLVIMEAMKMEYAIKAPAHGRIRHLLCQEKATVKAGQHLVELEPTPATEATT